MIDNPNPIFVDDQKLEQIERLRKQKRRLCLDDGKISPEEKAVKFSNLCTSFTELGCMVNAGECLSRATYWGRVALGDQAPAEPEVPVDTGFAEPEPRDYTDV